MKTTMAERSEARLHYQDSEFLFPAEQEFIGRLLDDADHAEELDGISASVEKALTDWLANEWGKGVIRRARNLLRAMRDMS